jgi:hypothetical protein
MKGGFHAPGQYHMPSELKCYYKYIVNDFPAGEYPPRFVLERQMKSGKMEELIFSDGNTNPTDGKNQGNIPAASWKGVYSQTGYKTHIKIEAEVQLKLEAEV